MRGTVYISGPMSGYIEHNYPTFNRAASILRDAGFTVLNPAEHFDGDHDRPRSEYLRKDIEEVMKADAICLLPDWWQSPGATLEVTIAYNLGVRQFIEIDWAINFWHWVGYQSHAASLLPASLLPKGDPRGVAPGMKDGKQPTWWKYPAANADPTGKGPGVRHYNDDAITHEELYAFTQALKRQVETNIPVAQPGNPVSLMEAEGGWICELCFDAIVPFTGTACKECVSREEALKGEYNPEGLPPDHPAAMESEPFFDPYQGMKPPVICEEHMCVFPNGPCQDCQYEREFGESLAEALVEEDRGETPLEEAQRIVLGPRQSSYSHPGQDFRCTGRQWGALLENWLLAEHPDVLVDSTFPDIAPRVVALMMAALKASREAHKPKRDNRVDGPGYWFCADRIVEEY
jgi:hypothetical protein